MLVIKINKKKKEALLYTKNIVFFRESLYLNKKEDDYYLPYLYRIRDGKTLFPSDDTYETINHELNINNLLDLTDNIGLINSMKIADSCCLVFPKREILLPIYDCDDPKKYLFEVM